MSSLVYDQNQPKTWYDDSSLCVRINKMCLQQWRPNQELGRRCVDTASVSMKSERGISPMCPYQRGNRQKMYRLSELFTSASQIRWTGDCCIRSPPTWSSLTAVWHWDVFCDNPQLSVRMWEGHDKNGGLIHLWRGFLLAPILIMTVGHSLLSTGKTVCQITALILIIL